MFLPAILLSVTMASNLLCNLCYRNTPNEELNRSFIQSRGRARHAESRCIVFGSIQQQREILQEEQLALLIMKERNALVSSVYIVFILTQSAGEC
jgi:hypothetical protein